VGPTPQKGHRAKLELRVVGNIKTEMVGLLNSKQVMELLNIKSHTTLIKYEKREMIKVHSCIGNRKRYRKSDIMKLL